MLLSAALPVVTVAFLAIDGEAVRVAHRRLHLIGDVAGVAFFAWVALAATLWPLTRTWGAVPAEILVDAGGAEIRFQAEVVAAPGQAAVFYDGDRVLGGGWIAPAG